VTGVIGHIANPTADDAVALAASAEQNGARWIGFADAFWWRDVWMLLAAVAAATDRIEIGPAMTNGYLRHQFHTLSALATLHELAPHRVFCGLAAGGSEITAAAHIDRKDAPERAAVLAATIRAVAAGEPLDPESGRRLDVRLPSTPILMAGRGDRMLRAAGSTADRVLLWAMPNGDLDRSVDLVLDGARGRAAPPQLIWAPLVRHPEIAAGSLGHVAVYAALNTRADLRSTWGPTLSESSRFVGPSLQEKRQRPSILFPRPRSMI
jgi:alkanesulfonate monooxygenase SsuD/methylene tetrahydromethanopterin reductase-like flavin-dependent oxidoreductase (luciferase family)